MEFLIKRTDGEWFSLHQKHFIQVLRPKSIQSKPTEGWGDHRITLPNGKMAFSFEEPGLQVVFEEYSGTKEEAIQILNEILKNIEASTGEHGKIIEL